MLIRSVLSLLNREVREPASLKLESCISLHEARSNLVFFLTFSIAVGLILFVEAVNGLFFFTCDFVLLAIILGYRSVKETTSISDITCSADSAFDLLNTDSLP